MRINVRADRCIGAGQCVMSAGGIFDQEDATAEVVVLRPDVPPEEEQSVREAVALCPSGSLYLDG